MPAHLQGSSLLEVLISLILLMLMLLGFDALQLSALRAAKSAYYFGVAAQQIEVMIERLTVLGNRDTAHIVAEWNQQNAAALPQGISKLVGQYPSYQLLLFWGKPTDLACKQSQIDQSGCLSQRVVLT